jgi:hypothetical protein
MSVLIKNMYLVDIIHASAGTQNAQNWQLHNKWLMCLAII